MSRPRNKSTVQIPPRVKGFMPMGYYSNVHDPVQLNIEEFESLRLLDYENLTQEEAAEIMDVSRPTLTRIYERARKNIAIALTESRQITIEGGNVIFNGEWYECGNCKSRFNNYSGKKMSICPLCRSKVLIRIEDK